MLSILQGEGGTPPPAAGQPRPRSGFVKGVAVLGGGTALAQLFSVAVAPLLTRFYLPGDIGLLALFGSFLNLAAVGISLKYELGIVSAADDGEALRLLTWSIGFSIPTALLSGAAIYGAMRWRLLGYERLPWYTPLILVPALGFAGGYAALRYWFIRRERFPAVSHACVVQNAARCISQALFGLVGGGTPGLLVGELLGRTAGVSGMARETWPSIRQVIRHSSWAEFRQALKNHIKFPVYSLPSSFLDTAAMNITVPLLMSAYGPALTGEYALVVKVLGAPVVLVSASVADAFHSRCAQYAREAPPAIRRLFARTAGGLLLIGILPTLALLLFGPQMFSLVFGRNWAFAGALAAAVAPWFLAQAVVSPLSRLVFVLQGQELKLIYDVVTLIGTVAVLVYADWRGLSMLRAVELLSAVKTLSYVLYYLVLRRIVSERTSRPARQAEAEQVA